MAETTDVDRWRPVLPVAVVPRPRSVFWAKVPDRNTVNGLLYATGSQCTNPEHPVYLAVRPQHDTMPGCQGNEAKRTFWICARCCPPVEDERNG